MDNRRADIAIFCSQNLIAERYDVALPLTRGASAVQDTRTEKRSGASCFELGPRAIVATCFAKFPSHPDELARREVVYRHPGYERNIPLPSIAKLCPDHPSTPAFYTCWWRFIKIRAVMLLSCDGFIVLL